MPSQGAASFSEAFCHLPWGAHQCWRPVHFRRWQLENLVLLLRVLGSLLLRLLTSRMGLDGRNVEKMSVENREQGQWAEEPGRISREACSSEPAVWEVWEAGTRG